MNVQFLSVCISAISDHIDVLTTGSMQKYNIGFSGKVQNYESSLKYLLNDPKSFGNKQQYIKV